MLHKTVETSLAGCPVVKTLPFNAGGVGLIPGQGGKIPHVTGPKNPNTLPLPGAPKVALRSPHTPVLSIPCFQISGHTGKCRQIEEVT